jgi:hypothetical protein
MAHVLYKLNAIIRKMLFISNQRYQKYKKDLEIQSVDCL